MAVLTSRFGLDCAKLLVLTLLDGVCYKTVAIDNEIGRSKFYRLVVEARRNIGSSLRSL